MQIGPRHLLSRASSLTLLAGSQSAGSKSLPVSPGPAVKAQSTIDTYVQVGLSGHHQAMAGVCWPGKAGAIERQYEHVRTKPITETVDHGIRNSVIGVRVQG